jgi:CRISPR-associated protein Cas5d
MTTGYNVEFEVAGPMAMFARPDTGSTPISYPVPTWSACKAMFESVARGVFHEKREPPARAEPAAYFCPTEVEIWRPIRFEKYVTNYRGPLRKNKDINDGNSYQLAATVLVDVCYRVKGVCMRVPGVADGGVNAAHALQEMFIRRMRQGRSKYAPALGWKECLPSYFGPPRDHLSDAPNTPRLQQGLDLPVPACLISMWDTPTNGRYSPVFQELQVRAGRLAFPAICQKEGSSEGHA